MLILPTIIEQWMQLLLFNMCDEIFKFPIMQVTEAYIEIWSIIQANKLCHHVI